MDYKEYQKIIDQSMVEYVKNGGSLFYMSKEYLFDYDDPNDAADHKKILADKAVQAALRGQRPWPYPRRAVPRPLSGVYC